MGLGPSHTNIVKMQSILWGWVRLVLISVKCNQCYEMAALGNDWVPVTSMRYKMEAHDKFVLMTSRMYFFLGPSSRMYVLEPQSDD